MSKLSLLGIGCWLVGLCILGFQSISSMMNESKPGITGDFSWDNMTLIEVVGEDRFLWIDSISWGALQNGLDYVINMPMFMLLFAVGLIFLVLHFIWPKK